MNFWCYVRGIFLVQLYIHTTASTAIDHNLVQYENRSLSLHRDSVVSLARRYDFNADHSFFVIHQALDGIAWLVRFSIFQSVGQDPMQIVTAANDLVLFYSATLAVARATWAREAPSPVRRAHIDGMMLVFWSDMPIPFEFLDAFLTHVVSSKHYPIWHL